MRNVDDELNLEQVGRMLRVSPKTVRRRIEEGKIAAYIDEFNGRLIVDRAEVERILSRKIPYIPADKTGLSDTSATSVP